MKPDDSNMAVPASGKSLGPFRRAVLRGFALLLPPLLTIVIFLWVGHTVVVHLLEPMERTARWVLVDELADIRDADSVPAQQIADGIATIDGEKYMPTADEKYVPLGVYTFVREHVGANPMPTTAKQIYTEYVDETWLRRQYVVPVFLCGFLLVLYLLGKFLAAGIGRFFWNQFERAISRLPLVRNVYSSVKQVTDFLFSEHEIHYTRVVAIEYPRKGVWQLAFVTGEGMMEISEATREPMLAVFVPHSPVPFTGFIATVKKSETVDLNISVDQAIQFIVSCGVVAPPTQEFIERHRSGGKRMETFALSAVSDDD